MPFIFHDFETQSDADLSVVGGLKYALDASTRALLWSWCLDDAPVKLWVPNLEAELVPEVWAYVRSRAAAVDECPPEVVAALQKPDTYLCAWNAAFDRHTWQQVVTPDHGWPRIEIEQTLDAMAQGQASNLSGSLEWAGRALGLGHKTIGGKAVMLRFANRSQPLPGSPADIDALMAKGWSRERAVKAAIEMWALYMDYAVQDTDLLRDVWKTTRPLDATEWQEYWTSERINDRGMLADLDVCAGATAYREEESEHVAAECRRLTDGVIDRPTLTTQINAWLFEHLPDDIREHMVKERDAEGNVTRITAAKQVLLRVLEDIYVSDAPPEDNVVEFIELLQFGRSSSAVKFQKILNQAVDGRLTGSYVFNGAGQTGRMCVAAETLIDTPDGPKPIVNLQLGDNVITHLGRARPVEAVIRKGREEMYRLDGPNGAFITATAAHRLLTETGWKRLDECFDTTYAGPCSPREGCTPIPSAHALDDRDRGDVRADARDSQQDNSHGTVGRGTSSVTGSEPFSVENGGVEPDVREEDRGREDSEKRSSGGVERQRLHVRAPDDSRERTRSGEPSSASGSAPHRRRQVEQSPGQPGHRDEARSPVSAQAGAWSLVPVGEREVWDITVAGDASYCAQGLISHNSSRGVQIHNLPRDKVPNELDVLDMVAARVPIEDLRKLPLSKDDMAKNDRPPTSVNALLARLIRPTFHAPEGKMLVWGDWSAIEARVNPWLADTRDADKAVLQPFRSGEDLYILNAESIFNIPADVLYERYENGDPEAKGMRQAGKVAVLALGFLGSVGALRAMARGYGMRLSNEEAKLIVDGWRDRNRWARRFGDKCEEAAFTAMHQPLNSYKAGLLTYQYLPDLMGGTLACFLPDGRPIVYPMARISKVEKFGKEADAITYHNGMGRRSLWNGLQVENGTQAAAASVLRATLTRLEAEETEAIVIGDTHDEIICEVDEDKAEAFARRLEATMVAGFEWTKGLPLAAEVEIDWYYHK